MAIDQIRDAILSGDRSEETYANLPLPDTYRATTVHKDEVEMFKGLQSRDKDPRKSLHIDDVPIPELAPDEALVAVMASAINFNTVWTSIFEPVSTFGFLERYGRLNKYSKRHDLPYHIVGSDLSGVVLRTGGHVSKWKPGQEVVAHCLSVELEDADGHDDTMMDPQQRIWGFETNFGGLAELAIVKANQLMPKPAHLTWEESASPGLVNSTAYRQLISKNGAALKLGDRVLIWGASGGLGSYATQMALAAGADPRDFAAAYDEAEASRLWSDLDAPATALFPWDEASTYIRRPPFASAGDGTRLGRYTARPLLVLNDDITTDHISPAGAIPASGEAGRWLTARGENPRDLNVFSSRRGNWEVMLRGLYTNRNVVNLLAEDIPPGATVTPGGDVLPLWQAAARYRDAGEPVVIVAGERYGMGSSRDWAAKGAALLGARAVLASSFERIHRANLIGMGVLPLRLADGVAPQTLALTVHDLVEIDADPARIRPRAPVPVTIRHEDGRTARFTGTAAIETSLEVETLRQGGLLPLILKRVMGAAG